MEGEGHIDAKACGRRSRRATGEEEHVEEDQRHAEVEVDFDGDVILGFSVGQSTVSRCQPTTNLSIIGRLTLPTQPKMPAAKHIKKKQNKQT